MTRFLQAGFSCFMFIGHSIYAQSIYSFQGLGSLNHQGMPNNVGMGELGIATPTLWHVNIQNPANLVYNAFSTFQVGIQGESRSFKADNISESDFDGGLRFLAYAFPIKPGKWSSSFGILPFSSVSYNTFNESPLDDDPTIVQFVNDNGNGGLTNFFWANGFAINRKIFLGVRTNYTFGAIDKKSRISIDGDNVFASLVNFTNQTSYSGINFQFGATYRYNVSEKALLNFGLIYSIESTLKGKNVLALERLNRAGTTIETQELSNTTEQFNLPQILGLGVSYQKENSYLIGIDFEIQGWKNSADAPKEFRNQAKISLGGEWTPDYDNVDSYFKRATYRVGFNYQEVPYIVNNQPLNDFGINFGASFPVSNLSSIELALKYGQLGTRNNGLIKESYYRIVLGATVNDRWFIKRKYD